jgi:hypothetical protein
VICTELPTHTVFGKVKVELGIGLIATANVVVSEHPFWETITDNKSLPAPLHVNVYGPEPEPETTVAFPKFQV